MKFYLIRKFVWNLSISFVGSMLNLLLIYSILHFERAFLCLYLTDINFALFCI